MNIQISKPVYLVGRYNNIPQQESQNSDLSSALKVLASDISTCGGDVNDLDLDLDDSFKEVNARGSVGYSLTSLDQHETDLYYIDISVDIPAHDTYDYSHQTKATIALLKALSQLVEESTGFGLLKARLLSSDQERVTLRSYFVKNASSARVDKN